MLVWLDEYLIAPGNGSRPGTEEECLAVSHAPDTIFLQLGLLRHPSKGIWVWRYPFGASGTDNRHKNLSLLYNPIEIAKPARNGITTIEDGTTTKPVSQGNPAY